MAIDVVDQVLAILDERPIYVYHEIVHNTHVVGRFRDRGVIFVDDLDEVPEGRIVVFSAHGVSPAIREHARRRRLAAIDATCPLVTKVHSEAIRYARQGYQILLIGHRNHQEVAGTLGEAPGAMQVVETTGDIPRLEIIDPEKLVYLTQTTLSTDDAAVIIDALKRAFPSIKAPPSEDICYATTNRQHAVRQLAPSCDVVLVVGSKNSSNSVRLTEIARNVGTPAYLLDDVSGLRDEWFVARSRQAVQLQVSRITGAPESPDLVSPEGERTQPGAPALGLDAPHSEAPAGATDEMAGARSATVLLTAGASAPEDLVAGICRALVDRYGAELYTADVFEEDVEFALPAAMKRMMREKGRDPGERGIRVNRPIVTEQDYGRVALTVSVAKG